jgi:hypothetical protein
MRLEVAEERGPFGVLQGEYGVASIVSTLNVHAESFHRRREPSLLYLVSVCQVKAILLSGLTGKNVTGACVSIQFGALEYAKRYFSGRKIPGQQLSLREYSIYRPCGLARNSDCP